MKLLDQYNELREQIYDYFGYKEDWRVIPIDDRRQYAWYLEQESNGSGIVRYALDKESVVEETDTYYEDEIFTYCHLPKYVYRGEDFTMIVVDTHCDGNMFLAIFTNKKEIK